MSRPSALTIFRGIGLVVLAFGLQPAAAQSPAQVNGAYDGKMTEATKSRKPPCSPAQAMRVTVERGRVKVPPLLLGEGRSESISADVSADGTFTGKLPGAEMRGRIAGTTLTAKIIVPLRCVYDITAHRKP